MKKRSKEKKKKKRDRVEEDFVVRTRRRFDWKSPVSYVNHMETIENETKTIEKKFENVLFVRSFVCSFVRFFFEF